MAKPQLKIMIVHDDPDLCHALGSRLRANPYKTSRETVILHWL